MYDYLDRPIAMLGTDDRFLLRAARCWATAARGRQCAGRALTGAFADRGVADRLPDFGIAMTTLARDGSQALHLAGSACACPTDDEARLLALFAAARRGADAARRIAAGLVTDEAAPRLALAAAYVAEALMARAPTPAEG